MTQLGPWLRGSVPGRVARTASRTLRSGERRPARFLAVLALLAVLTTACGGPEAPPVPLPTFEPSQTASATAAEPAARTAPLPDDCARLMSTDELTALLGRPIGSVALRTVRGVPEPAVQRIARLSCRYTAAEPGGARLLTLNVARYATAEAAARQWTLNSDAERAGLPSRDTAIGSARAVLVERPDSTALILTYADSTITLLLPAGPPVAGRAAPEALVDLVLRVIPRVVPQAPAPRDGPDGPRAQVRAAAAAP